MTKQVTILSGPSGSGKSTFAVNRSDNYTAIVSADDFFVNAEGKYVFDPMKLSEAHGDCFRRFICALISGADHVIVDNTNTTVMEIAPYVLGAQAYGYQHVIVQMNTLLTPQELSMRNRHGVSWQAIEGQMRRLDALQLPPWWNSQVYTAVG